MSDYPYPYDPRGQMRTLEGARIWNAWTAVLMVMAVDIESVKEGWRAARDRVAKGKVGT